MALTASAVKSNDLNDIYLEIIPVIDNCPLLRNQNTGKYYAAPGNKIAFITRTCDGSGQITQLLAETREIIEVFSSPGVVNKQPAGFKQGKSTYNIKKEGFLYVNAVLHSLNPELELFICANETIVSSLNPPPHFYIDLSFQSTYNPLLPDTYIAIMKFFTNSDLTNCHISFYLVPGYVVVSFNCDQGIAQRIIERSESFPWNYMPGTTIAHNWTQKDMIIIDNTITPLPDGIDRGGITLPMIIPKIEENTGFLIQALFEKA